MSQIRPSLYYGDCLDWMRRWDTETADLVYLDPPFNSNADYNMLYATDGGGDAQFRAFSDTWRWDDSAADRLSAYRGAVGRPAHNAVDGLYRMLGECGMLAYLTYMAERLEECHRLLKPTGSIYLHCDPTASHTLKLLLDGIFGADRFRNEIVWKRTSTKSLGTQRYARDGDRILYYTKSSSDFVWNQQYRPHDPDYIEKNYRYDDDDGLGRYTTEQLTGGKAGGPDAYKPFRNVLPSKGRAWAPPRRYKFPPDPATRLPDNYEQLGVLDKCEALDSAGLLYWTKNGIPRYKSYLANKQGNPASDIITDIGPIGAHAHERLGYQTQKPVALLKRIIAASSNPGDFVLDPFCGCGTTVAAAESLGRRWAGIDISSFAVDVMLERLGDRTIPVHGIPQDLRSSRRLASDDPFGFETWAINQLRGFVPNTKQVADGGIDGRATLAVPPDDWDSRLALAQVKGGKHTASMLRDFCGVTDKTKAAVGCYITLTPIKSDAARGAAAALGKINVSGEPYRRMNLWSIAEHFDDRRPLLPTMNNPYTGKPMLQASLF